MQISRSVIMVTSLVVVSGCSSLKQPETYIRHPTVCVDKGWYGYHKGSGCPSTVKAVAPDPAQETTARLAALEKDRHRLADELEAARKQNGALNGRVSDLEGQLAAMQSGAGAAAILSSDLTAANRRVAELEGQLADRDKELAGLRGDLSAETAKLHEAQRGLIRALRPEIDKGSITVDLNSERLLINLASGQLFGSGEDQLKPAGAHALQRVGGVLKDYPEKHVHVAGYTDNVPIKGALLKKYPSNKELSGARANGAAQALRDGGVDNLTAAGHGENDPIASNSAAAGRAKNRRVEVIVK